MKNLAREWATLLTAQAYESIISYSPVGHQQLHGARGRPPCSARRRLANDCTPGLSGEGSARRGSTYFMPKTASKRAQARKMARVARAHAVAPERPVVRRTPSAKRKSSKPRGFAAFVSNYPWATTIFSLVVVGAILLILHQQQAWASGQSRPPSISVRMAASKSSGEQGFWRMASQPVSTHEP